MAQQKILRNQVLNAFKVLHRTRQFIFQGDEYALREGRTQINDNFRKNRNETDLLEIRKMVQMARDVDKELRTNVIQAVKKDEDVFELRITEGTTRLDNVMFNPDKVVGPPKGGAGGCCQGESSEKVANKT